MKKKLGVMLVFVIVLIAGSFTAFAGDVPESLLHSEDAQVFFGEVLEYYPDKENPDITVSPLAVMKGDLKVGTQQIYARPNPLGNFEVKKGGIYLFTYYDEHNDTNIFEVTTYDTRTLKLRHVEGNMWERFEKYLNDGEYGHAKVKGRVSYHTRLNYGIAGVAICIGSMLGLVFYKKWKRV